MKVEIGMKIKSLDDMCSKKCGISHKLFCRFRQDFFSILIGFFHSIFNQVHMRPTEYEEYVFTSQLFWHKLRGLVEVDSFYRKEKILIVFK